MELNYKTVTIIKYILYYLVPIIFMFYLFNAKYLDTSALLENTGLPGCEFYTYQFNIITVNSIFAGFLFTGLSLIIGLSNKKSVEFMIKAKRINKIYINIYIGIFANLLSILGCIAIICKISFIPHDLIIQLELVLITIGVLSLFVSIHHIRKLVKYISAGDLNK